MTSTPPGWYDDGHGALRWWDGAQWTEHVAPPAPEEPEESLPAELAAELDPAAAMATGVPVPGETPDYSGYAAGQTGATPYSGEHPGYPGLQGGAFTAATEPKKSKLWVLWLVIGVALLAVVIAAAVAIPLMFLGAVAGSGSGSNPVEIDQGVDVADADQQAAVAVVALYDEAWQKVDCDKFHQATTPDFREVVLLTTCDEFAKEAEAFSQSVDDYTVTVVGVTAQQDAILVDTVETYRSTVEQGAGASDWYEDHFEYVVIAVDDGWAIDDAYSADDFSGE